MCEMICVRYASIGNVLFDKGGMGEAAEEERRELDVPGASLLTGVLVMGDDSPDFGLASDLELAMLMSPIF